MKSSSGFICSRSDAPVTRPCASATASLALTIRGACARARASTSANPNTVCALAAPGHSDAAAQKRERRTENTHGSSSL